MKTKVHINTAVRHHAVVHIDLRSSITTTQFNNLVTQKSIDFCEKLGKFIRNTLQQADYRVRRSFVCRKTNT